MITAALGLIGLGGGKINWFRLIAAGAVVLTIVGTIYAGYQYVNNLQEENRILVANNATLEANNLQLTQSIADQQAAIASLQADMRLISEVQQDTFENFEAARGRVRDLEERLGRHELGFLASQRPGLVENIINDATEEVGRCFEIATGSPLTQQEINATLPSEINSECPELANPNYIPRSE